MVLNNASDKTAQAEKDKESGRKEELVSSSSGEQARVEPAPDEMPVPIKQRRKPKTENPYIKETSQIIKSIFENYAIYRYGNCRLDNKHLLHNSQQTKGAVIALHALLQRPNVRQYAHWDV